MTASKREQIIAIIAGLAILGYLGYTFVVTPYLEQRTQLQASINQAQAKYRQELQLLQNQPKVEAEWKALLATTLRTTPADTSSRTLDSLFDWARSANFDLQAIKPDRALQQGDFQLIHLQVSGQGSEANVAHWIGSIENSNLPLQIDEFRVNARKEGVDDLNLQLTLTALVFAPPPATRPGAKAHSTPTGETP